MSTVVLARIGADRRREARDQGAESGDPVDAVLIECIAPDEAAAGDVGRSDVVTPEGCR